MQNLGTKRLETDRLILRRFVKADAESVYKNWASDDEVTKYLTWETHKSAEDSARYVDFCLDGYKNADFYQWAIELKETGETGGNVSVVRITEDGAAELGWVLGRALWGRGIVPEAAEEVMRFLFDEVGFSRIYAEHDIENVKSGRVMQKIGMAYEGVLREARKNNRGVVDVAVYGLAKENFR